MAKTFILHDESLNTKGFWMMTSGADLEQFIKNPIMLWDHNRNYGDSRENKLPIGHWENIRIQGTQILADAAFDADEFSQLIASKVESGTLRMASMGATPIETSIDPIYIKHGQRYETVLKWRAKEVSIVNEGANNNALALSGAELYDEANNIIELSAGGNSLLKELAKPTKKENMNGVKKLLNLSADASEQDVLNALNPLLTLSADLDTEKKERALLQEKIEAIELAEKEAKTAEAKTEIAAALKDGRLSDDAEKSTTTFWLSAYDANFELASKNLKSLPKRKQIVGNLDDNDEVELSSWDKRMEEIKLSTGQ